MTHDRPTVLIADDDAALRRALSVRLAHAGLEVVTAQDGPSAIAALDHCVPDAVVLDVQMPGMDGFGVCEHIRSLPVRSGIPVIFLTGANEGIIRKNMDRLSAAVAGTRYLMKPVDGQMLAEVVWDAINESAEAAGQGRSAEGVTPSVSRTPTP